MYVQGVSTRKVKAITERLCAVEISAMQVSRAAAQLGAVLQEWRERPLGEITYLYVDARYEKVRQSGQVRDAAVLMATGITPKGERQVLGVSVSLSEHEIHWKSFLKGLKERGMNGVKLLISDDHEGLGAARRAILGSVPWKGASFTCNKMLERNAQTVHESRSSGRHTLHVQAPDRKTAEEFLQAAIQKYGVSAPILSAWLEESLSERFTVFDFPLEHRKSIRTTNRLERINKEIRRKPRVVSVFPNEASCLRLI